MSDLYAALGIAPSADDAAVKAACRAKAKAAHPDVGGSVEAFEAVQTAYAVMSDPVCRRQHLEQAIGQRDTERKRAMAALPKWEDMRDRFTARDGRPNLMAAIVAARIANINEIARQYEQSDRVARQALDVLAEHKFRRDVREPAALYQLPGFGFGFGVPPFTATAT